MWVGVAVGVLVGVGVGVAVGVWVGVGVGVGVAVGVWVGVGVGVGVAVGVWVGVGVGVGVAVGVWVGVGVGVSVGIAVRVLTLMPTLARVRRPGPIRLTVPAPPGLHPRTVTSILTSKATRTLAEEAPPAAQLPLASGPDTRMSTSTGLSLLTLPVTFDEPPYVDRGRTGAQGGADAACRRRRGFGRRRRGRRHRRWCRRRVRVGVLAEIRGQGEGFAPVGGIVRLGRREDDGYPGKSRTESPFSLGIAPSPG